jgi:hypothetical protein
MIVMSRTGEVIAPPVQSEQQRRTEQRDILLAEVLRAYLRRHPEALDALEEGKQWNI